MNWFARIKCEQSWNSGFSRLMVYENKVAVFCNMMIRDFGSLYVRDGREEEGSGALGWDEVELGNALAAALSKLYNLSDYLEGWNCLHC